MPPDGRGGAGLWAAVNLGARATPTTPPPEPPASLSLSCVKEGAFRASWLLNIGRRPHLALDTARRNWSIPAWSYLAPAHLALAWSPPARLQGVRVSDLKTKLSRTRLLCVCVHVDMGTRHVRVSGRRASKVPSDCDGEVVRMFTCGHQPRTSRTACTPFDPVISLPQTCAKKSFTTLRCFVMV